MLVEGLEGVSYGGYTQKNNGKLPDKSFPMDEKKRVWIV